MKKNRQINKPLSVFVKEHVVCSVTGEISDVLEKSNILSTILDAYELSPDSDNYVFSWHIVDSYLAQRLKEHEEVVFKWGQNYYWGRTDFGQAIEIDNVIREIAKEDGVT